MGVGRSNHWIVRRETGIFPVSSELDVAKIPNKYRWELNILLGAMWYKNSDFIRSMGRHSGLYADSHE